MKHIIKNRLTLMMLSVASVALVSCSDDDAISNLPASICPSSIVFNLPSDIQQLIYKDETGANVLPLIKGESVNLEYTMTPENITYKDVVWTTSNPAVATVDNGKVMAVSGDGTGYSIVQVAPIAMYSGSGVYSNLKVAVVNELAPAQTITISSDVDNVYAGETLQLSASILPENATYRTVKWSSSNESVAKVDMNGLLTGIENDNIHAKVIITATSLDGAGITASKEITVDKRVPPEDVSIDQTYSVDKGYLFAISDKKVTLNYTTVPEDCTKSLIEWSSNNTEIATVNAGVVTFNQNGVFGDVIITATCPETGKSSSITLRLEEGLVRELFHDQNNYNWYDAKQSGNGTSSSHVWSDGKITVTTYKQNDTKQRADLKCWSPKTWLHAGKYPIFAVRMDDVRDLYKDQGVTACAINLDASGTCDGVTYSGNFGGDNNKWLHDYKCSDGSHVFIYNLSSQTWKNGGTMPTTSVATFTTLQFKYADIATITTQIQYDVHWIQTFKTLDDVKAYIESEGLTYDVIK
ncbi:Ig-like domain-containing protein [Bacteroides sp. GM023]|uniref:Ig-like domain-containing protein n=1 Tax=Bacteroides sp. GM023 TaxID=2723058 RepID=UPI00168AF2FB|nr:Ig-like domain-containing protein [Bacteroides sp. GM023]MBD3590013.1 DUF4979 domain-containing protein [Bacteroides sp. GM023]